MSDSYKRRTTSEDVYQCGCHWERVRGMGDVLVECQIHAQSTQARVRTFDRTTGGKP